MTGGGRLTVGVCVVLHRVRTARARRGSEAGALALAHATAATHALAALAITGGFRVSAILVNILRLRVESRGDTGFLLLVRAWLWTSEDARMGLKKRLYSCVLLTSRTRFG